MAVKTITVLTCDGCGKEFHPDPSYQPPSFAIAVARWHQFVVVLPALASPAARQRYSRTVLICPGCDPVDVAGAARAKLEARRAKAAELAAGKLAQGRDLFASGEPVRMLQLPIRAENCLEREGIHTIAELMEHTASELMEIRHFNIRSLEAVWQALAARGLALKGETADVPPTPPLTDHPSEAGER